MITMFRIDTKKNKDQKINEPTVKSSAKSSARITQPPWVSKSSDFSFFDVLLYLDFLLVKFTFAW